MPTIITPQEIAARPTLTSFPSYEEAQAAVDKLSDNKFPVEHVSIIGVDLRSVEAVLGRMSWGRAALGGLLMGAWLGVLLGLFVSLFATSEANLWTLVGLGLIYGAAFGIILGLINYAFTGGKRDFVSRSQLVAGRYDVTVDAEQMAAARNILGIPFGTAVGDGSAAGGSAAASSSETATPAS